MRLRMRVKWQNYDRRAAFFVWNSSSCHQELSDFASTAYATTPLKQKPGVQIKITFITPCMTVNTSALLLQTLPAFIFTTACPIYYPQRS